MAENYIGTRIKAARERLGWSRSKVAREVGVSHSAVNQWEAGAGINAENQRQLALVLDVPLEWLATGRGESNFGKPADGVVSPPPFVNKDPMERTAIACEYIAMQIYHIRLALERLAKINE